MNSYQNKTMCRSRSITLCFAAVCCRILFWLIAMYLTTFNVLADDRCDLLRKELVQRKDELSEYVEALTKSHAKDDYAFMDVLNFKINELVKRTKELEREIVGCPPPKSVQLPQGMSATKTEEEILGEKSCTDLKKMLVPLIRKVNTLKRREKSVLSGLSTEEKQELDKAQSELITVREHISRRCGASEPSKPFQRRLRQ